jgi:hypothetical protein
MQHSVGIDISNKGGIMNRGRRAVSVVCAVLSLAVLAGCASDGHGRDINDPSNSLVFGYIDMSEAPTKAEGVQIMQVAPPTERPYWGTNVQKGLFYTPFLPPGSYKLGAIHGSSFFRGENIYTFSQQGRGETGTRIDRPGIYFLGLYKYRPVKTGFFEQSKFAIERTSKPTEAELLRRILEEDSEIKSSRWAALIRARLERLK